MKMANQSVVATFANHDAAYKGVTRLLTVGVPVEVISFIEPIDPPTTKAASRRGSAGIALGASSGAIGGGMVGAFVVGLPDIGVAIVATIVGVAFGAYAGAFLASLFGAEAREEHDVVEEKVAGRVLLTAEFSDRSLEARAVSVLRSSDALEVKTVETGELEARLHVSGGRPLAVPLESDEPAARVA